MIPKQKRRQKAGAGARSGKKRNGILWEIKTTGANVRSLIFG
jgi:hypothetical protein